MPVSAPNKHVHPVRAEKEGLRGRGKQEVSYESFGKETHNKKDFAVAVISEKKRLQTGGKIQN